MGEGAQRGSTFGARDAHAVQVLRLVEDEHRAGAALETLEDVEPQLEARVRVLAVRGAARLADQVQRTEDLSHGGVVDLVVRSACDGARRRPCRLVVGLEDGIERVAQTLTRGRLREPRVEPLEKPHGSLRRKRRALDETPQVPLRIAEVLVEALDREPEDGPPLGERARLEVQQVMCLAGAVLAQQDGEDGAVVRGGLEELRDAGVDLLHADGEARDRLERGQALRDPHEGAELRRMALARLEWLRDGRERRGRIVGRQRDPRLVRDRRSRRHVRDDARGERRMIEERVHATIEVPRADEEDLAGHDAVTPVRIVDDLPQDRVRDVAALRREVDQRFGIAQHDARAAMAEGADEARQIGQRPLCRPCRERAEVVRLTRDVAPPEPRLELAGRARAGRRGNVLAREQVELTAKGLLVGTLLEERLGAAAVRPRERVHCGDDAVSTPGIDVRCAHRGREGTDNGMQVLQAVLGERRRSDREAVGERGIPERVDDGRGVPVPRDDGHGTHASHGDVSDGLQARPDDVIDPLHARGSRHTQRDSAGSEASVKHSRGDRREREDWEGVTRGSVRQGRAMGPNGARPDVVVSRRCRADGRVRPVQPRRA